MEEDVSKGEQARAWRDSEDRKQINDFKVGTRRTPLSNNVLMLIGDLLQPQTTGFDHVNMDMSFSYLDRGSVEQVQNSSFLINYFKLWSFRKPMYLERGNLATKLNVYKSLNGQSMKLFTNTVSTTKQEFMDKTGKKQGFNLFGRGSGGK